MDKHPSNIVDAANRIAARNNMSVEQVLAAFKKAVKKTKYSAKDFLLKRR